MEKKWVIFLAVLTLFVLGLTAYFFYFSEGVLMSPGQSCATFLRLFIEKGCFKSSMEGLSFAKINPQEKELRASDCSNLAGKLQACAPKDVGGDILGECQVETFCGIFDDFKNDQSINKWIHVLGVGNFGIKNQMLNLVPNYLESSDMMLLGDKCFVAPEGGNEISYSTDIFIERGKNVHASGFVSPVTQMGEVVAVACDPQLASVEPNLAFVGDNSCIVAAQLGSFSAGLQHFMGSVPYGSVIHANFAYNKNTGEGSVSVSGSNFTPTPTINPLTPDGYFIPESNGFASANIGMANFPVVLLIEGDTFTGQGEPVSTEGITDNVYFCNTA